MSHEIRRNNIGLPVEQGLYDPANEHDACGFGFIADIHNQPKHEIVHQALESCTTSTTAARLVLTH